MFNKISKICFTLMFLLMLAIPLVSTNLQNGKISEAENRTLASFPQVYKEDGTRNENFTTDFETWINDNIGFRSDMVIQNARIQYYLFNVLSNNSDNILGPKGELNYATPAIISSYQHIYLKSDETLNNIAKGFQNAKNYLDEKGIQLYYFQCWDKQSIYPEYFPNTVIQYGNISMTDQIVDTLEKETNVTVISPKQELINGKEKYDTYSKWGDPSHWTQRGAYIGYQSLMGAINHNNNNMYKLLSEKDYNITVVDQGATVFGGIHQEDDLENFEIKDPKAILTNEKLTLYSEDQRHGFYTNNQVDNDTRLLILGDSYFASFIADDIAESFHEVVLIWGDYTSDFENIVNEYNPDIIVVENVERCDRTDVFASVCMDLPIK